MMREKERERRKQEEERWCKIGLKTLLLQPELNQSRKGKA